MTRTIKLNLNGYYTYTAWQNLSDDGHTSFDLTIHPDGTVSGAGRDHPGSFVISGVLINDDLRFIKQYVGQSLSWKYVGRRIAPYGNVYQFAGGWGPVLSNKQDGHFVFAGVEINPPGPLQPHQPIEGQWTGEYFYSANIGQRDGPMYITLGLDFSQFYRPDGPYALVGTGTDGIGNFRLKGTVTKVNPNGSGGEFDVMKGYGSESSGWTWRYQGKYDGRDSVGGTWGPVNGGGSGGSFQLSQTSKLPIPTAKAVLPATTVCFGWPSPSERTSVESALRIAASQGTVASNLILNLVEGFSS